MPHYLNSLYLCQDFFCLCLNFIVVIRERFKPGQVVLKGCSSVHMVKHLSGGRGGGEVGKRDGEVGKGGRGGDEQEHTSNLPLSYQMLPQRHQEGTTSFATIPVPLAEQG